MPLALSPRQLLNYVVSQEIQVFLDEKAFLRPGTPAPQVIDEFLTKCIEFAQSEFERRTATCLFHTRIISNPPPAGAVRGTNYDVLESPYDFRSRDWQRGKSGSITLRRRPIHTIHSMSVRYGQSQPTPILTFPERWIHPRKGRGTVELLPIVGPAQLSGALIMVPLFQLGMGARQVISMVVSVEYTAGFLPRSFNPDTDSLADACPDFDIQGVLEVISKLATVRLIDQLSIQSDSESGSLSMGPISESVSPGRFLTIKQNVRADAETLLGEIKSLYAPLPAMML